MKKNYVFKPWIPENYGKTNLGKLFIVGDSHYIKHDEKDLPNFTIDIISEMGDYPPFKFFRELGKSFNTEDYSEIYSKAAFANAIQVGMLEADQKPSEEDFKTVEPAIKEYLEELQPDRMIVFSKRVWENGLPNEISWGEHVDTISIEDYKLSATVWKFNYSTGFCYGIGVYHPSYPGFNSAKMKLLIDKFLATDYSKLNP